MREPFDTPLSGRPIRIEFSPCGRWLALTEQPAQEPPRLTVFDVGTGGLLWSTHCLSEEVGLYPHGMAFGPSGDEIANVEPDFSISRREARTGKLKSSIDVPEHESLTGIRYSPDGKSLLIRRPHKDILVVDCASGAIVDRVSDRCLGMFRTVHGDVWLEAEPSRELVLRGGPRSPPMLTLRGLAETPLTPVTSSDGRYIAVPGGDRVVYFWDLARGGLPGKCVGHESVIRAVGFSPDSRTIISQSDDGTVRFWNIATRAELLKLGTAQNPIMCMGLNPKGDLLVLGAHCHGRWGLQIHRLGPDRDSLPKQFDPPPSSER